MRRPETSPATNRACLMAVAAILTEQARRPLTGGHRRTLEALARHLFPIDGPVDRLPPQVTDALTVAMTDPDLARLFSLVACVAPLTVEIPTPGSVRALEAVLHRTGLAGVPRLPVDGIRAVVDGRRGGARLHLVAGMVREVYRHPSVLTALPALIAFERGWLPADRRGITLPDLLARPAHTFGHALGCYYRDNDFDFAGERGVLARMTVPHDARHVLFGWDTSIEGESGIAPCEAGLDPQPMYAYLTAALAVAQTGFDIAGDTRPFLSRVDVDVFFAQIARGMAADPVLMTDMDFLACADEPLDEMRARFGIEPGGNVGPGDPWCGPDGPKAHVGTELHRLLVLPESGERLIAVSLTGRCTVADLEAIGALIDGAPEGPVDLVLRLQRFRGWRDVAGLAHALRWWRRRARRLRRVALLGQGPILRRALGLDARISRSLGPEIRAFDVHALDAALHFCRTGDAAAPATPPAPGGLR